jgi:hypothetical protein
MCVYNIIGSKENILGDGVLLGKTTLACGKWASGGELRAVGKVARVAVLSEMIHD